MIDLNEIEKAAIAATGMNFDSAQAVHIGDGFIECPHCCGSGEVELAADYCNFDGAAIGVQFYGVGTEHVSAEQFYRAVNPSAVIELIECLRQAEKDAARYRWLMENAKLGIGRNGKDWDLQVDGPAPDAISEVSAWIDNHA